MKISNLTVKISAVCGTYADIVTLPDGTSGKINFTFEYSSEYGHIHIDSGYLTVGSSSSVTFSKSATKYTTTQHGRIPDEWNTSQFIMDIIADLQANLASAKPEVKLHLSSK